MVLSLVPLGALAVLPLLLTGFLVGEAISATARRWDGRGLAVVAFLCAAVGPLLGKALLIAPLVPVEGLTAKAAGALLVAGRGTGILELLLLVAAGVIATTRVSRG
jgi:hypothetical protein